IKCGLFLGSKQGLIFYILQPSFHKNNLLSHSFVFIVSAISSLQKIGKILLNGGVIAVPTDTVYGLACCGLNTQALKRLYEIKGRDAAKPMAICLDKASSIHQWCNTSHISEKLLATLLPGPVTVILPRRQPLDPLSPLLNPGVAEIGIRVPDHFVVREIPEALATAFRDSSKDCLSGLHIPDVAAVAGAMALPIVLTSANPSGFQSTLAPEEFQSLWPQLDLIIDGGRIVTNESEGLDPGDHNASRAGSTVVDLSECVRSPGSNLYTIVREGRCVLIFSPFLPTFHLK
ncbi:unnamed protein product, partial [Schistocephalus solidus]|uniref:Threonylcarbamoyl-AMP synthase n=1 Tax=Schistocephalus solidus TaxID=70667 RepID=A0A183TJF7_SCHSO